MLKNHFLLAFASFLFTGLALQPIVNSQTQTNKLISAFQNEQPNIWSENRLNEFLIASASDDVDLALNNLLSGAAPQGGRQYIKAVADPFGQANVEFNNFVVPFGVPIANQGGGIRSASLPDGSTISVRPTSSEPSNVPTIQVNRPTSKTPYKIRYYRLLSM